MSRHQEIFNRITELEREEDPFAVATVIMLQGSSSGKVGDKAIYGKNGKRVLGYIGGGCIENRVDKKQLWRASPTEIRESSILIWIAMKWGWASPVEEIWQ